MTSVFDKVHSWPPVTLYVYWNWFQENDTPLDRVWERVDQELGQQLYEQITEGQDDS